MDKYKKLLAIQQIYPEFYTVFGRHSDCVEPVNEEVRVPGKTTKEQIELHSDEAQDKIHEDNKLPEDVHVKKYTLGSKNYNKDLRELHVGNKITDTNRKNTLTGIDKVLNKSSIKHDTHVYTGVTRSPAKEFSSTKAVLNKDGNVLLHLPTYTSTTTHASTAREFSKAIPAMSKEEQKKHTPANIGATVPEKDVKHIIKIHLPKGTKAGSVRDQAEYEDEQEVLLHRGHNIEIHKHPTVLKDGTHIWHAKVISHTPDKIE